MADGIQVSELKTQHYGELLQRNENGIVNWIHDETINSEPVQNRRFELFQRHRTITQHKIESIQKN